MRADPYRDDKLAASDDPQGFAGTSMKDVYRPRDEPGSDRTLRSVPILPSKSFDCCVLIPVYRNHPEGYECFNMEQSAKFLDAWDICIVHPEHIDPLWLQGIFPEAKRLMLESHWFESTKTYSKLCLTIDFYRLFLCYEKILILQPDAILLTDELRYWVDRSYDYAGAPIGATIYINDPQLVASMIPETSGLIRQLPKGSVGNGGLSLRRVKSCCDVLSRHNTIVEKFVNHGLAEDIFFLLCGLASPHFRVPNEVAASLFSVEHWADEYIKFNGRMPFGTHAWARLNLPYWLQLFKSLGLRPYAV